ncbi:MAG TPA: YceI family protein [Puia sp.]|nr:YceI family protein [Puia sp.]
MNTTKWIVDPSHSEIHFKVKHLMISNVTGHFNQFSVSAETVGEDFSKVTNIVFAADVHSIDTGNSQRDNHLKSADFFNGETHSKIHFHSDKYEKKGNKELLHGNLTIHGMTKPITVDVKFGGIAGDLYGQIKVGFTIGGKFSRKEFGITYNATTEAGGVVIGDEVVFGGEIQLIKRVEKN